MRKLTVNFLKTATCRYPFDQLPFVGLFIRLRKNFRISHLLNLND